LEARTANQAAKGYDILGNRIGAPGAIGSPEDTLQGKLRDLQIERNLNPNVNTAEREEQAYREYREAIEKAAKAAADLTDGLKGAGNEADRLSRAHAGAVQASDAVTSAFANLAGAAGGGDTSGLTPERGGTRGAPGSWQAFFEAADKG